MFTLRGNVQYEQNILLHESSNLFTEQRANNNRAVGNQADVAAPIKIEKNLQIKNGWISLNHKLSLNSVSI